MDGVRKTIFRASSRSRARSLQKKRTTRYHDPEVKMGCFLSIKKLKQDSEESLGNYMLTKEPSEKRRCKRSGFLRVE